MIPVTIFAGRDVAVFGLGLSGIAAAHALAAGGARVLAWDDTQAARDKAAAQGVTLRDLAGADWTRDRCAGARSRHSSDPSRAPLEREAGASSGRRGHRRHRALLPRAGEGRVRAPRSWSSPAPTANRPPPRSPRICCSWAAGPSRLAAISASAVLDLPPFCSGPHLCARAVDVPDRPDAVARPRRRGAPQHHPRPSRPPRHHRELRRHQGARIRSACRRTAPP